MNNLESIEKEEFARSNKTTSLYKTSAQDRPSNDRRDLFALEQLEVSWDEGRNALWTFMRPRGRPSYNLEILKDFHAWQREIQATFTGREDEIHYLLLGSRWPGVFSLGGDLGLFAGKILADDREGLVAYGRSCVRILHKNFYGLNLPLTTIGLVQGDALGGGFESLLSFNVVIAERGTKFGFPESLFGLFPGMGAYNLLSRLLGAARAEEMILSGQTYTAEEMHALGIVHVLAEPGEGLDETLRFIERQKRRRNGNRSVYQAGRDILPLSLAELDHIVEIWADACLQLSERDLRVMQRLVAAQDRLQSVPLAAQ